MKFNTRNSKKISIIAIVLFCILLVSLAITNIDNIKKNVDKFKHKQLIYNINDKLKNYLVANIKIVFIQFIEYSSIFFVIGHPNYLLLGLLNSINSFVPYVGTLLTNILAVVTASVIDRKLLILTSIVSVLLPNIDSYLVTPKIYKDTTKLPQTLCVGSVIIFGLMFNFYGIIFAMPILIVLIEVLKYKNIVKID